MRRNWLVCPASVALLVAVSACSPKAVLKPNPQPRTSYEMVVPKTALRYSLQPGETAVQPLPDKQVAPVYPPSLVRPGAAPVTVVAQLVMDKDGRVEAVYPVPGTDKGPGRLQFEDAIKHAAMQWKFTPLWIERAKPDGTYRLATKPFSLWYVFHFTVVDGTPRVETIQR